MKNLGTSKLLPAMLVVMLSVLAASAQQPQPPKNYVESSPKSDTGAKKRGRPRPQSTRSVENSIVSSCNAAVDELKASRTLIDALEMENSALKLRLETEKRANAQQRTKRSPRKTQPSLLRTS